jgi:hypothetical protein
MSIELKPAEKILRSEIEERLNKARAAFEEGRLGDDARQWLLEAGKKAHELHMVLKQRGHEPRHHAYMIRNRELPADHEEFYMHFHPLEDLLKFLANKHANDDPIDQTIGVEFEFCVFSRRWGHDDSYHITRTADGWTVGHLMINGPCDKGGRPFLFENLRHDSISFPDGLDGWMEWLWNQAASSGLSAEQVQQGINQLAEWVSATEKSAPHGGLWEGY